MREEAYSDVLQESQKIAELALKGMLRNAGIEPPKWHDVGSLIVEYKNRFPKTVAGRSEELAEVSKWLRKEREFSFYGEIDFIPTQEYSKQDARKAIKGARLAVAQARSVIKKPPVK